MKLLIKNIYLMVIALVAITFSSCNDDEGAEDLPEIIVGFTQTIDIQTGTVTFINISENADTYSWDFGDGTSSIEINPEKTFENGTYTVVLTAINGADISDTAQDEITILVPDVVTLPITFDLENVAYEASVFGGASFGLVDNPDVSGSNDKASIVGSVTNIGAAFEGLFFDLGAQIDLSTDQAIKMNFWSEAAVDILMKLEEGTAGATETTASHGGTGWETITFNFSSEAQYSRLTFFVDGPGTTAGTFYFDDVEQTERLVIPILPTAAAPAPTQAEANVISVYSDAYTDVSRDGFNLYGAAAFEEVQIGENGVLKYTSAGGDGGSFQVIELGGANQIDAAAAGMTNFRFDIWFPNEVNTSSAFLMKLVDFGATTSEAQININASSNPAIAQGSWLQFDIPFSELQSNGLAASSNIQQVVIDLSTSGEVYIDNIYFYGTGGSGGAPTSPAPTPTQTAGDVISVFSDAYTDVPRDGFNLYGAAAFEEVQISGNGVLKYTFAAVDGGNFQVIELGGANQIDAAAAGMTNFRFDIWFSKELDASSAFLMKLVDFGATTSEAQININASSNPAIAKGSWLRFDIPFSELQSNGLAASSNIQQVVIDLSTSGEVYIDNIYFYSAGGSGGGGAPTSPAPTPTETASEVISVFSDAYTDVPRDGFNLYGAAAFEEVQISGNGVLKYTATEDGGGNFQVIELGGANQINAAGAGMTNFRFDIWFPNELDAASAFLMKLVDFGAATSEAQINVNASSNPAIARGTWLQFDIPFSELQSNGLAASGNIQQVVIDLVNSGEVYIDNIYFYGSGGGGGGGGPEPALPLDFENNETLTAFDGGAFAANADNPDMNGNPSAKVLQFNKIVGSAWYSGVVFDETLRTTPLIDLANGTTFTVKIWSPKAGITVRFQLEGGAAPAYEVFQTLNTANEWVTLTFDFASQVNASDTYPRFSFFPDFDTSNQVDVTTEAIYYIDDITQVN